MTLSTAVVPLLALVMAAPVPAQTAAPDRLALPNLADLPLAENRQRCRERIAMVRDDRGLPPLPELDRDPEPDRDRTGPEPLLIAAVDRQIDGCPVLVMYRDHDDIREVPQPDDRRAGLIPAG
ncbi:hypothetical protein [Croceicoccus marinus]|uniref:Uncharacterized protein n=1 Tax=Croceicoccus marinus TaxID=450378 RepID=A0A7G6VQD8_9SPHN|nr:hypothetical protein [Croceicoccus marinus]QNE03953.1 hypothetical protein H4O24_07905 [Croceicoccus marinus]